MQDPLRLCIIGAGQIAEEVHLPILSRIGEVSVVGIHDVVKGRAEILAKRFGIRRVYDSLEELEGADIDVVDICTPPQSHEHLVVQSLENGIHCLVEKPFSVTEEECEIMIKTAQRNKGKLFPIQNYSFTPAMIKAKSMAKNGDIGKVVSASYHHYTSFNDHRHRLFLGQEHWVHQMPGDVFSDLATHAAFSLVEMLGKPTQVRAVVQNTRGSPHLMGDGLQVIVTTKEAIGSFLVSYGSDMRLFLGEVIGTKGALRIDGNSQAVVKWRPVNDSRNTITRGRQAVSEILQLTSNLIGTATNVAFRRYSPVTYGHEYLFRKCFRNIRLGEPYPISVWDVKDSVALCEKAFEQIATKN